MTTEIKALRAVAKEARNALIRVDRPMRTKLHVLAAAIDALDAAEMTGSDGSQENKG